MTTNPEDDMEKTSNITLKCGDCLELMKELPDKSVDLVVTSPPYNINLRIRGSKYCKRSKNEIGPCNKYIGFTDDLSVDEYFNFHNLALTEMIRVSKQTFYIIQPVTGNKEALFRLIGEHHKNIKEIIIWDKKHSEPAIMRQVLNSEYEFIIIFDKETSRQRMFHNGTFDRGTLSNIFRQGKSTERIKGHGATFPVELIRKIISNFSKSNQLILDPFMGSGTTGVACKELGRDFIGFELDPTYFDIAKNRIESVLL